LLAGGSVHVKKYNNTNTQAFRVLVNASLWCMQAGGGCIVDGKFCFDDSCVGKASICHTVPGKAGEPPPPPICHEQPGCKNATSGAYDVPMVEGCIDYGPPSTLQSLQRDEVGAGMFSRRALLGDSSKGRPPPSLPYWETTTWVSVDVTAGARDTVVLDLSNLNGSTPFAVTYAWNNKDDTCCNAGKNPAISNGFEQCMPAACPIELPDTRAPFGGLPGNPWIAKIVQGKCECLAPQKCDETGF
jgi:hypothetical protein